MSHSRGGFSKLGRRQPRPAANLPTSFCKALSASMPRINESATSLIRRIRLSPPCPCAPERPPPLCPRFQASIHFPLGTFSEWGWK